MPQFLVDVEQTFFATIEVEAANADEALELAEQQVIETYIADWQEGGDIEVLGVQGGY